VQVSIRVDFQAVLTDGRGLRMTNKQRELDRLRRLLEDARLLESIHRSSPTPRNRTHSGTTPSGVLPPELRGFSTR
jgi:hypothetical protein